MKEISVVELKAKIDAKEDYQLVDVREQYEIDICSIGGDSIPMGTVLNETEKISRDKQVIIHCRSGQRSAAVIMQLESAHGYENLYNLTGGILAYADEVDNSLTKY
ncbi:MAG: NADH oxidase [Bacteroidetes bacterium]|nr:MAG: NADH oxidase [Bacteroidota bacterium]